VAQSRRDLRTHRLSRRRYAATVAVLLTVLVGVGSSVADEAAADREECFVDFGAAVVADEQENGFMRRRDASINDYRIDERQRRIAVDHR
jgi:hypothetical protein